MLTPYLIAYIKDHAGVLIEFLVIVCLMVYGYNWIYDRGERNGEAKIRAQIEVSAKQAEKESKVAANATESAKAETKQIMDEISKKIETIPARTYYKIVNGECKLTPTFTSDVNKFIDAANKGKK